MFEKTYQKILWGSFGVFVVSIIGMLMLLKKYENENKELKTQEICNNSAANLAYLSANPPLDGMDCTMWHGSMCRSGSTLNGNCNVPPSKGMQLLILIFSASIIGMIWGFYKKISDGGETKTA